MKIGPDAEKLLVNLAEMWLGASAHLVVRQGYPNPLEVRH